MTLDPVKLALVQKRLDFVSRHMGWVMTRTARSPIFSQSHDFSCFLTDGVGTLVSNADGIPIHTGGGGFAVRALLSAFDGAAGSGTSGYGTVGEGDVFLLNDPYAAGGDHLPDRRHFAVRRELRDRFLRRAIQVSVRQEAQEIRNRVDPDLLEDIGSAVPDPVHPFDAELMDVRHAINALGTRGCDGAHLDPVES